ncbi:uncharacterized protein METZ01_LOCUS450929, partial [marine metagenome]
RGQSPGRRGPRLDRQVPTQSSRPASIPENLPDAVPGLCAAASV